MEIQSKLIRLTVKTTIWWIYFQHTRAVFASMPPKRLFGFFDFYFSFTIFLRHLHYNQCRCATYWPRVWLRWLEKGIHMHMFTTIRTQLGQRENARKRHDHLSASASLDAVILFANSSVIFTPSCNYHDPCFKQKQKRWVLFCF